MIANRFTADPMKKSPACAPGFFSRYCG